MLGFVSLPFTLPATKPVLTRTDGPSLNAALAKTGALLAAFSLAVSAGLLLT
jgi:1,4-dihydroxy-2-naphthoate octaprenyltransferase